MTGGVIVLLAVDDSAASFAAARQAVGLAAALHGRVLAVTVLPPRPATGTGARADHRAVAAPQARAHHPHGRPADGTLAVVAGLARDRGVPFESRTLRGRVAEQLLGLSRETGATYLVVGHAYRPGAGLPHLDRTAEQVLEFSEIPVLVVPVPAAPRPWPPPGDGPGSGHPGGSSR